MNDFSVIGSTFENYLHNLTLVLKRCMETNLVLNWEKCHFMVREGKVLGIAYPEMELRLIWPRLRS